MALLFLLGAAHEFEFVGGPVVAFEGDEHDTEQTLFVLVDELVILVPVLIPLILTWVQFDRMDAILNPVAPDASMHRRWLSRVSQYLLIPLIPILLLSGVRDGLALAAPEAGETTLEAWAMLLPLVVVLLTLPLLIRWCWPTSRRSRISRICSRKSR